MKNEEVATCVTINKPGVIRDEIKNNLEKIVRNNVCMHQFILF